MDWREYIHLDPAIMVGKPVVKGTRLTVDFLLDLVAAGCSIAEILEEYPGLTEAQVRACIAYAAEVVRADRVFPLAG